MSKDRLDDLLDRTIASGAIPPEASSEERAELERLLESIGVVREARIRADAEAVASMPIARARFERFAAAHQPAPISRPPRAVSRARFLTWGRLVPGRTTATLAGSAAGIGVLAILALLVWQLAFNSTTSAYAQVVEPGDYVQVEGVIDKTNDGLLSLKSELGEVEVEVGDTTTAVSDTAAVDVSTLKRGDRVLVGGIAGEGRRLAAQTVALSGDVGPPPRVISFRELERLRPDLEGRVVTYTISSDGTRGAVLIDAGGGERFLVRVDGRSAEALLTRTSTALGQRVRVREASGVTAGTFSLEVPATIPPADRTRPTFVTVAGVVLSVQLQRAAPDSGRILEGLVTVQTDRGPAQVVVRNTTRVLPGESGLTPGAGLRGEATGHAIHVSGGLDKRTGQVVADVIVMGPKVERSPD